MFTFVNMKMIKKISELSHVSGKRIFVNASIDTLIESYMATKGGTRVGYNVFPSGNSTLFHLMDHFVGKHMTNGILAHTQFQKKTYQRIGIAEESISIIPHCIDIDRIRKMASRDTIARTEEKPTFFYAGRLHFAKGVRELVTAFQNLSRKIPSTLVVVGDGPLKGWVSEKRKAMEQDSGKSEIVFLDGWRSPWDFLPYMAQADIVVLPSYSEMSPIILLEAMTLGKATLATDVGGIPEIIKEGWSGLLVKPRNVEQLEEALSKLASDPLLRKRLGSNATKIIREKHDVSVLAPKFLRFMERDI